MELQTKQDLIKLKSNQRKLKENNLESTISLTFYT